MSTGRVRRRRTAAGLLLGIAAAGLACPPVASASPGRIVDMAEQCREQYPRDAQFLPAEAYLVAPRDAFSWRCKRVSISPKGGIVGDLAVDPNAYCSRLNAGPAVISITHPPNWECTG
jgi:hypothetical protein